MTVPKMQQAWYATMRRTAQTRFTVAPWPTPHRMQYASWRKAQSGSAKPGYAIANCAAM